MNPLRLTPSLREKVWGRTRLEPWFPDSPVPIGEAWYLPPTGLLPGDRDLPLLVKLLFTSDRLSIQVHPDDGEGVPQGKTEMHHILEAEPGAAIALGFRRPITREHLREACATGEIEELVNWFPVEAGETYFTPAHTVHAIGAGIVLCEIQQNTDITYRLWDYGRPRERHVDRAVPIADIGVHPGPIRPVALGGGRNLLVRSRHFVTEEVCLAAGATFAPAPEACQLIVCLEGCCAIGTQPVRAGEVWLLPQEDEPAVIRGETGARFLRTFAPAACHNEIDC
jgi:mannose-6-phosphate isomerase